MSQNDRMSYQEALRALAALGAELRTGVGAVAQKFTLDHIRVLLAALGEPQRQFPAVLIAGTNGKGSTAATLSSIVRTAGVRTGLYTSPHLVRVNERMQVDGREIPDEAFGRYFGTAWEAADRLVAEGGLPHRPSFFELLTATAFLYFAEERIGLAVLEVGLGGRLDATNVVEPLVSVIADIGMDHMEFLGNTLGEIAREKAGILRQHGVLVTLSQHPEANAAIGEVAVALEVRGVDASRCLPPRGFTGLDAVELPPRLGGSSAALSGGAQGAAAAWNQNEREGSALVAHEDMPADLPPLRADQLGRNQYPLSLEGRIVAIDSPLRGQHQQRNIALAVATALELRANHGFTVPDEAIEAGVRETVWPGRLEWLTPNPSAVPPRPPVLLDVAHNPAGAWTLRAALSTLPEERPRTLVFSCLADKQIEEMARILLPMFDSSSGDTLRRRDHVVLAPIANPRAATVDQLLEAARALDVPAHAAPHLGAALQQAQVLTPADGLVVVTGSVYLVGEARALLLDQGAHRAGSSV